MLEVKETIDTMSSTRDENGLPVWMHGKHPIWEKCMICGTFVDPLVYKDYTCPACRRQDERDMECTECMQMKYRHEMHNNFICEECWNNAKR